MKKNTKYSIEILKKAVRDNYTLSNVMRSLNLVPRGSNFSRFKKMLIDLNIDTSHFKQPGRQGSIHTIDTFKQEVLKLNGKEWNSYSIKHKLFEFNLLKEECSICRIGNIWNNQPLKLQLDHIDGNCKNNNILNLRILCPNCYSQTETYSGKNKKK